MTEMEKLRALLPHWIEHNREHASEVDRWADIAATEGHSDAARMIRQAVENVRQANGLLDRALEDLGGAVPLETHGHGH